MLAGQLNEAGGTVERSVPWDVAERAQRDHRVPSFPRIAAGGLKQGSPQSPTAGVTSDSQLFDVWVPGDELEPDESDGRAPGNQNQQRWL